MKKIRTAILGASGYTGAELIRLLINHPYVNLIALTAERQAGKALGDVFPHLAHLDLPNLIKISDIDFAGIDFVFCCLPHGTTQEVIAGLPDHVRIVDLSADFRLYDVDTYAEWYGHPHKAEHLQKDAVYGLTEWVKDKIKSARLVANPGCYPTSVQLPLIPLLKDGVIEATDIIADSKSGITGAGRDPKQDTLFSETSDSIHAYGIAKHRHTPEIEQGLSEYARQPVSITFTPHLMPMNRGILSTIYVKLKAGKTAEDIRACWIKYYFKEPFVEVLHEGKLPATRFVRGTNNCQIAVVEDRITGRAIIVSVIDNLNKGASGQAVHNMNIMMGWDETLALPRVAVFP